MCPAPWTGCAFTRIRCLACPTTTSTICADSIVRIFFEFTVPISMAVVKLGPSRSQISRSCLASDTRNQGGRVEQPLVAPVVGAG